MEARKVLLALSAILAIWIVAPIQSTNAQHPSPNRRGQQYRVPTENFVVFAPDPKLAQRVASEAERYRKELAIEWTGKEIGRWNDKCPIQVELGMHAGGETSFAFVTDGRGKGLPVSWQMKIFGPPDRILDAVLPHEITHTIFATHFGRPLPRWADEGACTTVEHESERQKNHRMLIDFLNARPSRGIAFNRMFTMRDYPHDILPLYAQGYSLAKFLIMQNGKRHFLDYIGAGMNAESQGRELRAWDYVTKEYYGFKDLSDLQIAWIGWVKNGSREIPNRPLAANSAVANLDRSANCASEHLREREREGPNFHCQPRTSECTVKLFRELVRKSSQRIGRGQGRGESRVARNVQSQNDR